LKTVSANVHDNEITVNNLRFVIHLMPTGMV